jgi:hypothetical protein
MNRSPAGPMVYLPATAQVETNVTALALISPAPDAGWRPRFARMTCAHPLPAVDAAITVCEREQSGAALCVAGTLTTAAFDQAGRLHCRKGAEWLDTGVFAWSHRKFSLVQTFVCRMKLWRNIRSGPCWNPLGT